MARKVLVLEDESSIRSFIVINLTRAGYEVIESGTGEEALEKLQDTGRRTRTGACEYRFSILPHAHLLDDHPEPLRDLGGVHLIEYWKIFWHNYRTDGSSEQEAITYHNTTDGWYLLLPKMWDSHLPGPPGRCL